MRGGMDRWITDLGLWRHTVDGHSENQHEIIAGSILHRQCPVPFAGVHNVRTMGNLLPSHISGGLFGDRVEAPLQGLQQGI